MIHLGTIRQADPSKYDEIWVICRSVGKLGEFIQKHDNVFHIPELSPEQPLLYWYLNEKKAGNWNNETFINGYVPQFTASLKNHTAITRLNDLVAKSHTNKEILLVCFCADETMCHRSIVGGILLNMNASIDCNPDYAKYHI